MADTVTEIPSEPTCPKCGATLFTDVRHASGRVLKACQGCQHVHNACDLTGNRFLVMHTIHHREKPNVPVN